MTYNYSIVDVTAETTEPVEVEASDPIPGELADIVAGARLSMEWEEIREVTRCQGHCCRSFTLPSPVELGQKVIKSRRHRAGEDVDGWVLPEADAEWVATALTYLGEHVDSPSGFNNITKPPVDKPGYHYTPSSDPQHWYSCRHLKDGSCAIYDRRPEVCSGYPYKGNECQSSACQRRTVMASGLSWWWVVEPGELLVKAMMEES
jgi:Fe-S-cluster containining protein